MNNTRSKYWIVKNGDDWHIRCPGGSMIYSLNGVVSELNMLVEKVNLLEKELSSARVNKALDEALNSGDGV